MAEDTLTFDNLRQVLQEYAQDIRNLYQDELIRHDKIASGNLLNSVEFEVQEGEQSFKVNLELEHYWKYVEEGIAPAGQYPNPLWKAYPFILDWIKVKPILPKPDKNGRLPSPQSLAYLITRKIVNKGIDPTHAFAETKEQVDAKYLPRIIEAFAKDIEGHMHQWFEFG